MIYIIKQEAGGVVSKKVNSILVFSCICKMGYYPSPFQFVYFPNSGVLSTGQIISFFIFDRLSLKTLKPALYGMNNFIIA